MVSKSSANCAYARARAFGILLRSSVNVLSRCMNSSSSAFMLRARYTPLTSKSSDVLKNSSSLSPFFFFFFFFLLILLLSLNSFVQLVTSLIDSINTFCILTSILLNCVSLFSRCVCHLFFDDGSADSGN